MLIEIHMLQNHAPSNLNRDDTGSPKDCVFGGVPRARISSQCLKRSIRQSVLFREELSGFLGSRTRTLPKRVQEESAKLGCDPTVSQLIAKKASGLGSSKESDDGETRQLIFLGDAEVPTLARRLKELCEQHGKEKFESMKTDDLEKALSSKELPRSVDIALFGRFTTSAAFEDVQAAMQVQHAFSTGRIENEFDYFTAVDDLIDRSEDQGAGMIGDVEFNSATYYKYFSLHWDQLVRNLGGDVETARRAVAAFVKAAALTTPSGKQNSFAAHNPPDLVLIEVKREHVPVSYANAFVDPVHRGPNGDIVEGSIRALSDYATRLKTAYAIQPVSSAYLSVRDVAITGSTPEASLPALIQVTLTAVDGAPEATV